MVKKTVKQQDGSFDHQSQQYDHPIPGRHYILQYLQQQKRPLSFENLVEALGLQSAEEKDGLEKRLNAMIRDGQVLKNRSGHFATVKRLNLVCGRVSAHRDGFGFVIPDDPDVDDVYLHGRQMQGVFHGDQVLVVVKPSDKHRREGSLVEVLSHNTTHVVGRYQEEENLAYVVPTSQQISQDIIIPPGCSGKAQPGQIVWVEITRQPHKRRSPIGKVAKIIGGMSDQGMTIDIALYEQGIPHQWPETIQPELTALPTTVELDANDSERHDLRGKAFITIDGEDAKDFDDAVYAEPAGQGWRLWVAIADVSHYVASGSALDHVAADRGNSVYFPQRVIPMLPEAISNELCSLKPQVDRLVLTCEMRIEPTGKVSRSKFYTAIIHSHARCTYRQIAEIMETERQPEGAIWQKIAPSLNALQQLFEALLKARAERGAIEFETQESQCHFDEHGHITAIEPVQRTIAHRLIEECMLAANVSAARFLLRHKQSTLFRVHQRPSADKLTQLREYLKTMGLTLEGGDKPEAIDYQALLPQIAKRPDNLFIQLSLLRSMMQASYHPENKGHFGLAYPAYTHFTSPIRRYPDLLVHRHIKQVLGLLPPEPNQNLAAIAGHCSLTERRADDAVRSVLETLKCVYMKDKIGSHFTGTVTGVTNFGLFLQLTELRVDGLLHISQLPSEYYHYDATHQRLTGEASGRKYQMGDVLTVLVAAVHVDERRIDFSLAAPQTSKPSNRRRSTRRKPRRQMH